MDRTVRGDLTREFFNLTAECHAWKRRIVDARPGTNVGTLVAKFDELNETRLRIGRQAGLVPA